MYILQQQNNNDNMCERGGHTRTHTNTPRENVVVLSDPLCARELMVVYMQCWTTTKSLL